MKYSAQFSAVREHEHQLIAGFKRMKRKEGGHDGWCVGEFEGVAKIAVDGDRLGVGAITLLKLTRKMPRWIGYYLIEAQEVIEKGSPV